MQKAYSITPFAFIVVKQCFMLLAVTVLSSFSQTHPTLHNTVICGYQGWFGCYGDGSPLECRDVLFPTPKPTPGNQKFEIYPDINPRSFFRPGMPHSEMADQLNFFPRILQQQSTCASSYKLTCFSRVTILSILLYNPGFTQFVWEWQSPYPQGNSLNCACFCNDRFAAVGELGTIIVSSDGMDWKTQFITGHSLNSIAYGNGMVIVVGDSGLILSSNDFENWNINYLENKSNLGSVVYIKNRFITESQFGELSTSEDGSVWKNILSHNEKDTHPLSYITQFLPDPGDVISVTLPTNKSQNTKFKSRVNCVAFNGKLFVAVGGSGIILFSNNGIT